MSRAEAVTTVIVIVGALSGNAGASVSGGAPGVTGQQAETVSTVVTEFAADGDLNALVGFRA